MIALAIATSSLSNPVRSGPNRMPRFSPKAAAVAPIATLGLRTAFICPRSRAVVA
jgi:hypothetical protein